MGKIYLMDDAGNSVAQANYGADVLSFEISPDGDERRLEEYENDGYILPLEIADARYQLQKVINSGKTHRGGIFGTGGYGGTSKLSIQPSSIREEAPEDPDCHVMRVSVELQEEHRVCDGTFLWFKTGCGPKLKSTTVDMWMQWEGGRVFLSQYPEAPQCPEPELEEPGPADLPPVLSDELIAATLMQSLVGFFGAPIAAIQYLGKVFG